jgi:aspartyl/glutamyl-tRNA(Asn/Gln) amidotransferase C subunit
MDGSEKPLLSLAEVQHVAKLARLRLSKAQLELYRRQLATVLEHVGRLKELDLSGVEPLAHPLEQSNRLDEDEVASAMPLEGLLRNAPAVQDRFLAVPKILEEGGGP